MFTEESTPPARPFLFLSGMNHRSSPVEIRERFSLSTEKNEEALAHLVANPLINEAVVLSTCNRVEFVLACAADGSEREVRPQVEDLFQKVSGVSRGEFSSQLYHFRDREVVSHVFRVASGLDSLVLGEPQVLGQLKSAYDLARTAGTSKALLNRLFHRAFHVAKAVRTNTQIGQNAVSVCYAAKELAEQVFGDLREASVMLIGAGDMGALSTKHFHAAGAREFFIVNKTLSRACELAEMCHGVPLRLENLPDYLGKADIIIGASTLQPGDPALVTRGTAMAAAKQRLGKPQLYIDLAVPRNIDPTIHDVAEVFLYNVDDLKAVVDDNLAGRLAEAKRAEILVDDEVRRFCVWLERSHIEESIRELASQYRDFQLLEIEKSLKRLHRLSASMENQEELRAVLEDFAHALLAKALHQPLTSLKNLAPHDHHVLETFRELFLGKRKD